MAALYPNVEAPFENPFDVVNRLLPYHVFQYPKKGFKGKAKARVDNINDSLNEITGKGYDFKYPKPDHIYIH